MAEITALARLQQSAGSIIDNPKDLAEKMREWKTVAHVMAPAVQLSAFAAQHIIAPAVVVFDPKMDANGLGTDVYHSNLFHRGTDECSLTRVALDKFAAVAGANVHTARTDPRTIAGYWEMQATISYTDIDGKQREVTRTAEYDLRDGSELAKGMKPAQLAQARRFGLRHCEARACNAAMRAAWGFPGKYTVRDLALPFVALRVMFVPNMKDPMQARIVAEQGMGARRALYSPSGRADDIVVEAERVQTVDTPSGKVDAATGEIVGDAKPSNGNGAATTEAAGQQQPAEPTGPTITGVRLEEGKTVEKRDAQGNITSKGGRPYTRHFITLSDGRELHTFDTNIGKLAKELMDSKAPIDVVPQETRWGLDIVELRRAQPRLPIDDDGPTDADVAGKY